jgi:hypothetical protein
MKQLTAFSSGLENRDYRRWESVALTTRHPLSPKSWHSLTSPTIGGRSVGIVRSRTKATEFSCLYCVLFLMLDHRLYNGFIWRITAVPYWPFLTPCISQHCTPITLYSGVILSPPRDMPQTSCRIGFLLPPGDWRPKMRVWGHLNSSQRKDHVTLIASDPSRLAPLWLRFVPCRPSAASPLVSLFYLTLASCIFVPHARQSHTTSGS